MNFEFDCECGEEVSEFTRSNGSEVSTRAKCDGCDMVYAFTITPLGESSEGL